MAAHERKREQARIRQRQYAEKHRLLVRAKRRLYYAKNTKRELQQHRAWLKRNKEKVKITSRAYRSTHPEQVREWKRASYQRHRNVIRAKQSDYYQKNRERLKAKSKAAYWGDRDPVRDRKRPGPKRKQPQPPYGFVNEQQLAICLADPRQAWLICGPSIIVCLECGGKFSTLSRHLRWHGMTAAEYKARPGTDRKASLSRYNTNASLMSLELQGSRRHTSKRLGLGKPNIGRAWGPIQRRPRKGTIQSRLNQRDGMFRVLRGGKRPPAKKKSGRPPRRRPLFLKARAMHDDGSSWAQIAKELIPAEFREDWRAAKERIRRGVTNLSRKKSQ